MLAFTRAPPRTELVGPSTVGTPGAETGWPVRVAVDFALSYASPNMFNRGIFDSDGTALDPCDDYTVIGQTCPVVVTRWNEVIEQETGRQNILPLQVQ